MTNTDTADADATALQVAALAHAGSELVRITVNNDAAARGRAGHPPQARRPGHRRAAHRRLPLQRPPAPGRASRRRRRRWPSTASTPATSARKRRDEHFATIVRVAIEHDKPVRIGVNWGSLDQDLLTELMDANARVGGARGRARRDDRGHAPVGPALGGAGRGDRPRPTTASSSAPRSAACRDLVDVYRELAAPLRLPAAPRPHRGRHGHEGHGGLDGGARHPARRGHRRHHPRLAHAAARRRPHRGGAGRHAGPAVARPALVPAAGQRLPGLRPHHEHVLPGDGRSASSGTSASACRSGRRAIRASRTCTWRSWAASSTGRASRSTPTSASACRAPSRSRWRRSSSTARCDTTLRGEGLVDEFIAILDGYVERRYGSAGGAVGR